MFLKKLYYFNKTAFTLLLLFVFTFIYINYKWGATATPVYQYGMFSSKFYIKDTQMAFKIYVDDKLLDVTKYPFAKRDMLFVSLENYTEQKNINATVYGVMKKIPEKIGLTGLMKPEVYANSIDDETFAKWYRKLLEKITGQPIIRLEVYQQKVLWQNSVLKEIAPPEKLSFFVTY